MGKAVKSVGEFAVIAFTLLGVLFGMMIMTFIFGLLGTGSVLGTSDTLVTVTNETGAWLNGTTYTVDNAGVAGFGNLIITSAINTTTNTSIGTGNFSVSGTGYNNATATISPTEKVWVSYTYTRDSDARVSADEVQNNSLQAIVSYTGQADTQLLTVGIAITLVVLIAVFLLFWVVFIKGKAGKGASGGNFG